MNNDIYCTYMDLERLGFRFREFSMDAQCSVLKCVGQGQVAISEKMAMGCFNCSTYCRSPPNQEIKLIV